MKQTSKLAIQARGQQWWDGGWLVGLRRSERVWLDLRALPTGPLPAELCFPAPPDPRPPAPQAARLLAVISARSLDLMLTHFANPVLHFRLKALARSIVSHQEEAGHRSGLMVHLGVGKNKNPDRGPRGRAQPPRRWVPQFWPSTSFSPRRIESRVYRNSKR